jgi:hypothetical protein
VFGLNQRLVGALAVSGPRYRMEATGVAPILRVLLQHASQLTKAFGGDTEIFAEAPGARQRAPKRPARARSLGVAGPRR